VFGFGVPRGKKSGCEWGGGGGGLRVGEVFCAGMTADDTYAGGVGRKLTKKEKRRERFRNCWSVTLQSAHKGVKKNLGMRGVEDTQGGGKGHGETRDRNLEKERIRRDGESCKGGQKVAVWGRLSHERKGYTA